MNTGPWRALVVGDRFIPGELFAGALDASARAAGVRLEIGTLQLDYPAVDAVPLPTAGGAPLRPLWEDPAVAAARAAARWSASARTRGTSGWPCGSRPTAPARGASSR